MAGAAATSSGRAPGGGTASGPRRTTRSPASPSGSRDVATTVSPSHVPTRRAARSRHSSSTCSQLSSTRTGAPMARRSMATVRRSWRSGVRRPRAAPSASGSRAPSSTAASSTNATSRVPSSRRSATTSRVRRVLPTPPGPTRVTSRSPATSCVSSASSRRRPTRGEGGRARLAGRPAVARGANIPVAISVSSAAMAGEGSSPVSSASRRRRSCTTRSASAERPSKASDASQHQLGALTERVGGGGASGVVDQRGVGPGRQSHLEEAVLQVAAQLLQPDTRGGQRGHVGELVEGRAPPLPQRITEQAHGLAGRDLLAPARELTHLDRVELAGQQHEAVAVALPDQPVGGPAEVAPHPRHVAVQRTPPRVGDLGGPHRARAARRR